jgi:hypothetical protein
VVELLQLGLQLGVRVGHGGRVGRDVGTAAVERMCAVAAQDMSICQSSNAWHEDEDGQGAWNRLACVKRRPVNRKMPGDCSARIGGLSGTVRGMTFHATVAASCASC